MIYLSKPIIGEEEKEAVLQVLESGMIVQGEKVLALERELAVLCGVKYAVVTSSGTAALHTALYAIGIKPDDEVITTSFSFIATANAILMAGAKPEFVDVDFQTFNIDPGKIEEAITKKTRAILAVDLYGQPANYPAINRIARKYKLKVVEDAAQAINATYKSKRSGNLGDVGCFSFYATKNIMCGEGGAITTNNKDYAERARQFRHHGQNEKVRYEYLGMGYNYRLTDIQAAIALAQLKRIKEVTKKRQEIAARYNQAFRNVIGLVTPIVDPNSTHVYHQYTLRISRDFKISRDELKNYLWDKGIASEVYYPKPLPYISHLERYGQGGSYYIAENAAGEVLSIPVHPLLTGTEVDYIIDVLLKI